MGPGLEQPEASGSRESDSKYQARGNRIKPFLLPPRLIANPLTSILKNYLAAHRLLFLSETDLSELTEIWLEHQRPRPYVCKSRWRLFAVTVPTPPRPICSIQLGTKGKRFPAPGEHPGCRTKVARKYRVVSDRDFYIMLDAF